MDLQEEMNAFTAKAEESAKLTAEDLEQVAGGGSYEIRTDMWCDACQFRTVWEGDYLNGLKYDCPRCHEHAFYGTRHN